MALYVNTNASSLNAQRMMANSTNALDTSYKRLASGLRLNSAKDDAAGLQISDRLTSQINGLNQGNRNAQDGISMAQTAEGAMDEMVTMYQRIRTLALQSANGTNSQADRDALQQEVDSLCSEIDRIAKDTTFGGSDQKLLIGKNSAKVKVTTSGEGASATTTTVLEGQDYSNTRNRAATKVDFQVGADKEQTISVTLGLDVGEGNAAKSYGFSVADVAVSKGLGAATDFKGDDAFLKKNEASGSDDFNVSFDISSAATSQKTLSHIDDFIAVIDGKRAELGAVQNRLESTIRNQSNVAENVSAARSRIRDTDFASETAAMTQQNIIQQASQSILSQANQRPQVALSLLG